jgi:uncharacterized membrane protein
MVIEKQKRIIFIDLMRALAVFMMVQGHTIDTFLSPEYKSADLPLFGIWNYIRGFTAPVFMFSAGVAFTYLFCINGKKFKENPRVKKGVKRFGLLILLAYFLRFPTYHIFRYNDVTDAQWVAFFTVDTLHLIAFGLLFILLTFYLSEKLKAKPIPLLLFGALVFISLHIVFEPIAWVKFMHPMIAGYFYAGSGSFFPLFPWVAYVLCGAALGCKIAQNPGKVRESRFGIKLMLIAIAVFAAGKSLEQIKFALNWGEPFWVNAIYLLTLRLSVVIFMNGLMSLIAFRINSIPKVVKLFGSHSLFIYVAHLIILYGNAWIPGLDLLYYQKFNLLTTIGLALLMLFLMGSLVLSIDFYKTQVNKKIIPVKKPQLQVEVIKK